MQTLKKLALRLAISLGTLLLLAIIGEAVTRSMEPGSFTLWDTRPYTPHETLRHVHIPGFEGRWDGSWYQINSQGNRGPELELQDKVKEYRVVCLGDSCTFGKGVDEPDCWPRQLESLLQHEATQRGADWQPKVANLGINGFSGKSYKRMFEQRGKQLEPDLVVIGYNLNDFPNAIRAVDVAVYGKRGLRQAVPRGTRDFLGRFALYRYARATYYVMNQEKDWANAENFAKGAGDASLDSDVWIEQRDYLTGIRDEALATGAQVAVFLFPYESQVYLDSYVETPILRLSAMCAELEIPFVDLATKFRSEARKTDPPAGLFLRGDRYHPNPHGYRIVAESVKDLAMDKGWLPNDN
ncbi:MAG: lysophospholipase L1-like esterase [Planctomycetota bacterium]|jgi:lysophospholipase L1-like esterase